MLELTLTERAYLKAIFEMGSGEEPIPPTRLARAFGVSRVSSLEMLRKLAAKGYGEYWPKKGFVLSRDGRVVAQALIRKHRLLECLLHDTLGVPKASVCSEASSVDQYLSDNLVLRIDDVLGHPEKCPCGKPIGAAAKED